jgi:hypothetical protein
MNKIERELTEILDRRLHLSHTNNISDGSFSGNDTSKRIGVFFTKLFKQNDAKLRQDVSTRIEHPKKQHTLFKSPISPHCLMTTANLVVKSAACCRTFALLLPSRKSTTDTICIK